MSRILFSPIGMTDPITNLRDGSMLHICRVYKPDEIILYMSKEVIDYHEKDNRYAYCIEQLSKKLNHSIKITYIKRPDLINVQEYDIFYDDFHSIIGNLLKNMQSDDELLVNVASGTPAMKSALLILSVLAEYRFRPIQVSTPTKKGHKKLEDKDNYDVEANWELNEDNEEKFENRCTEPKTRNFSALLMKNNIRKLVSSYDYEAAVSLAEEIKEYISDEAMKLLIIGKERLRLNLSVVDKMAKNISYDITPIKSADQRKIFEYALSLNIKKVKGEYADFVRALTPLIADLIEILLEKKCNVDIDNYCHITKKGVRKFDEKKLEGTKIKSILDEEFKGNFKADLVGTRQMVPLIMNLSNDIALKEKVNNIMDIEQKVRNLPAHEIISVTPEWVKQQSHFTVEQIWNIIKYLIIEVGIKANEEAWNSYDIMNEYIFKELD